MPIGVFGNPHDRVTALAGRRHPICPRFRATLRLVVAQSALDTRVIEKFLFGGQDLQKPRWTCAAIYWRGIQIWRFPDD